MSKRAYRSIVQLAGMISVTALLVAGFQNCAPALPSDDIDYASLNAQQGKRPSPRSSVAGATPPPPSTSPFTSVSWEGICEQDPLKEAMAVQGTDRLAALMALSNPSTGQVALWNYSAEGVYRGQVCKMTEAGWVVKAIGDFNADNHPDVIWRNNQNGRVIIWLMMGSTRYDGGYIAQSVGFDWAIEATADVTGDRKADLIFRHDDGRIAIWAMDGKKAPTATVIGSIEADYAFVGTGLFDLSLPYRYDLVFRSKSTGRVRVWNINAALTSSTVFADSTLSIGDGTIPALNPMPSPVPSPVTTNFDLRAVGDFDGDAYADIMWQDRATRELRIFKLAGMNVVGDFRVAAPSADWSIRFPTEANGDYRTDLIWTIPTQNGPSPLVMTMNLVPYGSPRTLNPIRDGWQLFEYDRKVSY